MFPGPTLACRVETCPFHFSPSFAVVSISSTLLKPTLLLLLLGLFKKISLGDTQLHISKVQLWVVVSSLAGVTRCNNSWFLNWMLKITSMKTFSLLAPLLKLWWPCPPWPRLVVCGSSLPPAVGSYFSLPAAREHLLFILQLTQTLPVGF